MTVSDTIAQWRLVDEGWGRRAVDFATLSEPGNGREYIAMHQHLHIGRGPDHYGLVMADWRPDGHREVLGFGHGRRRCRPEGTLT